MTKPLRTFLLNEQISFEARRLAHGATKTCHGMLAASSYEEDMDGRVPNHDDWHSPACNKLKAAIEALCLNIKLAASQRPERKGDPPDSKATPVESDQCPHCFGSGRHQGKYGGPGWPDCGHCDGKGKIA